MIIQKTKLAQAFAFIVVGTALSTAASAGGVTMYNTFSTESGGDLGHNTVTDGWNRTFDNGTTSPGLATGPESQGNKGGFVPWVGTAGGVLPFSYTGSSHMNWAVDLINNGVVEVSRADAFANYGVAAEIDTGAGAWQDNSATPTGWKHQTDIGVIYAQQDLTVTLNLQRLDLPSTPGLTNDNFGITVFTGIDTNTGNYSHHGSWNCPGCATARPFTNSNPFGTVGLTYLTHDATVDTTNGLTFTAKAGQYYSIYLGGAGVGQWAQNVSDYALTITAVPEPASLTLFGAGLLGAFASKRRKTTAA